MTDFAGAILLNLPFGKKLNMDKRDMERSGGRLLAAEDLELLRARLSVPAALLEALAAWPFAGASFVIPTEVDESQEGAALRWLDAAQMCDAATQDQMSAVAANAGYIPIGVCLEGTGNPYFYRTEDGAIVRIRRDGVHGDKLDEEQVELVVESIEQFIASAQVEI